MRLRDRGVTDPMKLAATVVSAGRRPGEVRAAIALYWHLFARGGLVVQTPATGRAMIATTVQPDGDILVVIDRQVLSWSSTWQAAFHEAHFVELRQSLAQLTLLPELLGSVLTLAWLPFVVVQAYTVLTVPIEAAFRDEAGVLSLQALLDALLHQLRPEIAAVCLAAVRLLLPWAVRAALHRQWGTEFAAWRRDSVAWHKAQAKA